MPRENIEHIGGKDNKGGPERRAAISGQGAGRGIRTALKKISNPSRLLLLAAFIIGVGLRVYDFGKLPAGLNVDEASIAVEAESLYHYGIDRNGMSFPVYFVAWGSGQNVLYAYLLLPLVPLGLTPEIIRLPMVISGILTLLVVYGIARKLLSPTAAIFAIFLLAISPWHIMLSRWAVESNFLPFVFSLAFLCLLNVDRNPLWFPAGTALLAVSLYSYATAHFVVPLFLLLVVVFLFIKPVISKRVLFSGIALFALLAFPIFLYIMVNVFQLQPIHLGWITIPRLLSDPRFVESTGFLSGAGFQWYRNDFLTLVKILFLHTDGLVYNSLPPFGFLFPGAIVAAIVGAFLAAGKFRAQKTFGLWAFGAWLMLSIVLGIVQWPLVQRVNILFIPLILCVAEALDWIIRDKQFLVLPVAVGLLSYGVLFWRTYTGADYRFTIGWNFNNGMIPAIQSTMESPRLPVCVEDEFTFPYIYVQLVDLKDPRDWMADIKYVDPNVMFRIVEKMDRYSFGLENCSMGPNNIYILKSGQPFPLDASLFTAHIFGDYVVYYPKGKG